MVKKQMENRKDEQIVKWLKVRGELSGDIDIRLICEALARILEKLIQKDK